MTLSWLGTSAVSLQESNAAMLPAKGIAELPLTRALLRDFSFLLANLLYACEPNEYKYLWDILSQWDEGETFADASKCTGHGSLRRFLVACFKGEGSWIRSLKTQAGVAWLEKTFLFLRGRSYDGHTILNLDVQVLARLLISIPICGINSMPMRRYFSACYASCKHLSASNLWQLGAFGSLPVGGAASCSSQCPRSALRRSQPFLHQPCLLQLCWRFPSNLYTSCVSQVFAVAVSALGCLNYISMKSAAYRLVLRVLLALCRNIPCTGCQHHQKASLV